MLNQRDKGHVKKSLLFSVMAMFLVSIMLWELFPKISGEEIFSTYAETVNSGQCGDNVFWVLDKDGVLTISGKGDMYNYSDNDLFGRILSPWYCNEAVKKVLIEPGVTSIGDAVFWRCENLKAAVIPEGVTRIGHYSFFGCSELIMINIPSTVEEIGLSVFDVLYGEPHGLKDLYFNGTQAEWNKINRSAFNEGIYYAAKHFRLEPGTPNGSMGYYTNGEYGYIIYENKVIISKYLGEDKSGIIVPEAIDGYPVTIVDTSAFTDLSKLVSVYLPKYVETIAIGAVTVPGAFLNCSNLQNVFFDPANETYCDVDGVVYSKDKTRLILYPEGKSDISYKVIDGVLEVDFCSFYACDYIKEVTLPEGLLEIDSQAFYRCSNLRKINIPDSVTHIASFAFLLADNLGEIEDGVRYIDNWAVDAPDQIDIIIRNGTRGIAAGAFDWDQYSTKDKVERIELPQSLSIVCSNTFYRCYNINDVYYRGSENDWANIQIGSSNENLTNANIHFSSKKISFVRDSVYAVIDDDDALIQFEYSGIGGINTIECSMVDESIATVTKTETDPFGRNNTATIYVKGIKKGRTRLIVTVNSSETSFVDIISTEKQLVVGCNRTDLNITQGEFFILNAAINSEKGIGKSNIGFEYDSSKFEKLNDYNSEDYSRIALRALEMGNFEIRVVDAISGLTKIIPINVGSKKGNSYTIYSVPTIYEELNTNFIYNGMYIDSYGHQLKTDAQGNEYAEISFDVYNQRNSYGIVEVYDENGELINAELVDPADGLPTGVWEATVGGLSKLLDDIVFSVATGEWFTYRMETDTKKTSIKSLRVPKGGYIKITNDAIESDVLMLVQATDLLLEGCSVFKNTFKYSKNMLKESKEVLTEEFIKSLKINSPLKTAVKTVGKKVGKSVVDSELIVDAIFSESFAQAVIDVILNIDYYKLPLDIAKSDLEKIVFEAPGVPSFIKAILDTAFTSYGAINFYCTASSFGNSMNSGCISISVPDNTSRTFNDVSVSGAFDEYTSLEVFRVTFDDDIKDALPPQLSTIPEDYTFVYDITLYHNGQKIQPDGNILVYVRIPEELQPYAIGLNIYRIEEDGTATLLDTWFEKGKIVFTTEHLSKYVLIPSRMTDIIKYTITINKPSKNPPSTANLSAKAASSGGVVNLMIDEDGKLDLSKLLDGSYSLTISADNCAPRSYDITITNGVVSGLDDGIKLHLYGDLNGDGVVDVRDVAKVNQIVHETAVLTGYDFVVSDIDGDGKIDTVDVAKMNAHFKETLSLWS